jgi:hypothetical protein
MHMYHQMRTWWVDVVANATMGDNVHGVFADNALDLPPGWAGPGRAEALVAGQQALYDEVRARGKYIIFNGVRPREDYHSLDNLLPHASSGYCEPWLSGLFRDPVTGKLDAPTATHGLLRMINISRDQPDKGVTFKAGPGPCLGYIAGQELGCTWPFKNGSKPVPNGPNGTPPTPAGKRAAAGALIAFPLGTFLCAAGPRWHLDYTWGYTINDFVPGEPGTHAVAGQPSYQSYTPDGWYPELLKPPGTPLGPCKYSPATQTFAREWTGVSVKLFMANETATLVWK